MKKCSTPSCPNEAFSASLCKNCYAGAYYWMRKGVAAQQKRKSQLRTLSERLEDLRPAGRNVIPFRRRKSA